jgi:meromycolic acid enoyl-[acyl-carrier-protein] reductase
MLEGKKILISGLLTRHSIAYAVAEAAQRYGAEVLLTSFGKAMRITERAAQSLPATPEVLELDVTRGEDFPRLQEEVRERWEQIDGIVHAIASAPPDALAGNFLNTPAASAELSFRTSAFSFKELTVALLPLFENGGSVVGLDFDASVAWPAYDWMGVSKAALEAISRYLARDVGDCGVRANLVSSGPVETVAASAFAGFELLTEGWASRAPLGWDSKDAAVVADPVCFLLSDLARGITGEIIHVDGGFHAVGTP